MKLCLRKVSFKNDPIVDKNYDSFVVVVNGEDDSERSESRLKDLKLFHLEGFVIGEEFSAVVGFIKEGLFFGNLHVAENVYFVDPVAGNRSQRFSKFNDPLDVGLYPDRGLIAAQTLETLLQFYHKSDKSEKDYKLNK